MENPNVNLFFQEKYENILKLIKEIKLLQENKINFEETKNADRQENGFMQVPT